MYNRKKKSEIRLPLVTNNKEGLTRCNKSVIIDIYNNYYYHHDGSGPNVDNSETGMTTNAKINRNDKISMYFLILRRVLYRLD